MKSVLIQFTYGSRQASLLFGEVCLDRYHLYLAAKDVHAMLSTNGGWIILNSKEPHRGILAAYKAAAGGQATV